MCDWVAPTRHARTVGEKRELTGKEQSVECTFSSLDFLQRLREPYHSHVIPNPLGFLNTSHPLSCLACYICTYVLSNLVKKPNAYTLAIDEWTLKVSISLDLLCVYCFFPGYFLVKSITKDFIPFRGTAERRLT